MSRCTIVIALIVLSCIPANAFTISLAPLLTRLAPWGNNYVNHFSQTAPSLLEKEQVVQQRIVASASSSPKPPSFALDNIQFKHVDLLPDYKSEMLDFVYAKSMERGLMSA
jgi:hypothetical protein